MINMKREKKEKEKKKLLNSNFLLGVSIPSPTFRYILGQHYHPTFGPSRLTVTLKLVRKQGRRITKKEVVYHLYCVGHV